MFWAGGVAGGWGRGVIISTLNVYKGKMLHLLMSLLALQYSFPNQYFYPINICTLEVIK